MCKLMIKEEFVASVLLHNLMVKESQVWVSVWPGQEPPKYSNTS